MGSTSCVVPGQSLGLSPCLSLPDLELGWGQGIDCLGEAILIFEEFCIMEEIHQKGIDTDNQIFN